MKYRSLHIKHLIVPVFILLVQCVAAQNGRMSFDDFFDAVITYLGENDDGVAIDVEELRERLTIAYESPLNINGITRQQLEELIFLPDYQIENLLFYAEQYGPVRTIYELQFVPYIDRPLLLLLPTIMIAEPVDEPARWSDSFKNLKHNLSVRTDFSAEHRQAYLSTPKSYLGEEFRLLTKYRISAGNSFKAGITLESDAGEPWFTHNGRGFDLYRFYADFKNMHRLSHLVVGSYRAGFGRGLLFGNHNYGNMLTQVLKGAGASRGISAYGGSSELPALFGAAATVALWKNIELSALYSYTPLDADTTGRVWHSYSTTGYHRTETELARRSTLDLHTAAINAVFSGAWYRFGVTAYSGFFSLPAVPSHSDWAAYSFTGTMQWGVAADYMMKGKGVRFFGETAVVNKGAIATTNSLQIRLLSTTVTLNHRYFSPRYHAFWSDATASCSSVNAENGASLALKFPVSKKSAISALADVYKPLWPSQSTPMSRIGYILHVRADSKFSNNSFGYFSLRYKARPQWLKIDGEPFPATDYEKVVLFQTKINYDIVNFDFASGFQCNLAQKYSDNQLFSFGYHIYQDIAYTPDALPLNLRTRVSFHSSPEWANRFYAYEYDVPESGYSPALYGTALRWYLLADYTFKFGLSASVRISQTLFFDRKTISSGRDKINAPHDTDFHIYLTYRL